nr:immunoglobulin heavy chain junction region [Macaca mulatta]
CANSGLVAAGFDYW